MKTAEYTDGTHLETDLRENAPLCDMNTLTQKGTATEPTNRDILPFPSFKPVSLNAGDEYIAVVPTLSPLLHRGVEGKVEVGKGNAVSRLPVLRPDCTVRQVWDMTYDIMVLYSLCTTTYYLAYERPGTGMFAFDVVVWVFFVVDVFMTLSTGFFDTEGHLVTSRRAISLRYFSSWLLFDLLALLPFSFSGFSDPEYYLRLLRFLRLPSCLNFADGTGLGVLFRLMVKHLPEITIGDFRVSYYYLTLMCQEIVRMVALSYFLACIFYWYAKHTGPEHVYGELWFDDSAKLADQPASVKFLHSFYFILTTLMTIGYGDFLPLSFCEKLLMIVILVVGIANFSLIMGSFVSLIANVTEMNSSLYLQTQVSFWLDSFEGAGHPLPHSLKSRVITYFSQYAANDRLGPLAVAWWQAESVEDLTTPQDELFAGLPENERKEVLLHLFSDVFWRYRSNLGFRRCSFPFDICHHFQPRVFSAGEVILEERTEPEEIVLVIRGQVACEFGLMAAVHQFLTFTDRLAVAEYAVLTNTKAKFGFRAIGFAGVMGYAIPKRPFLDLLDRYSSPDLRGYCHKSELLRQSSLFDKTLARAKQDYIHRTNLPIPHILSQETLKISSKLLRLKAIHNPLLQYEDLRLSITELYDSIRSFVAQYQAQVPAQQSLKQRLGKSLERRLS